MAGRIGTEADATAAAPLTAMTAGAAAAAAAAPPAAVAAAFVAAAVGASMKSVTGLENNALISFRNSA